MSVSRAKSANLNFILFGAKRAGKTALQSRFANANDLLPETYVQTITSDSVSKIINNTAITVWDTSGGDLLRQCQIPFTSSATAILLVYDITNKTTFDELPVLIEKLKPFEKPMHLVGTHSGASKSAVDYTKVDDLMKQHPEIASSFLVDSTKGSTVSDMFKRLKHEYTVKAERKQILEAFKDNHLRIATSKNYDSEYSKSINTFYDEASKILANSDSDEIQKTALKTLAHKTFNHRHSLFKRVLLDALICISTIIGVGVVALVKHKMKYGTLFHCTAPTDREVEVSNLFNSSSPAA